MKMVSFKPQLGSCDPGPWWLSLGVRTFVICVGGTGPGARPMHPDQARVLSDQCVAAGGALFFKQWDGWSPEFMSLLMRMRIAPAGRDIARLLKLLDVYDVPLRYVGGHDAGSLPDGVEWKDFREVAL